MRRRESAPGPVASHAMGSVVEFVVFDLETNADRPDPSEHEIIQIGAVRAGLTGEADSFETLVRPERRLPERITRLTGLEYAELAGAPPLADALRRFLAWVGDRPMIAHNGLGYDFVVLDAAAARVGLEAPPGPRLDSLELAHLVHARAGTAIRGVDGRHPPPGRSLDDLAEFYGIPGRDRHEALVDARMTHRIVLRMLEEIDRPTPARRLQRWVLGRVGHPWTAFVSTAEQPVALDQVVPHPVSGHPVEATGRFDINKVVAAFRAGGALMTAGRTPRPQQAKMARLVSRAISRPGEPAMIEAPTGTGKTLAYLVPAIEMARASGRTAVITPHSRVLQDQILATLEELESQIGPFSKVVMKGRENYVSLKALDAELTGLDEETDRTPIHHATGMALAILCGWVAQTPTGDWADLRTAAIKSRLAPLRFLRWKLRVTDRPGPVRGPLDKLDFYRRARYALRRAHVAILNHALLATDPGLGDDFNLIIDEAHDLEDSVTAAASRIVSGEQLERLCAAIWDDEQRRGLVVRLANATGAGLRDPKITAMRQAVLDTRSAIEAFGAPLTEYLRDRTGISREEAARYGASYRIRRGVDTRHPAYQAVIDRERIMRRCLRRLINALDDFVVPRALRGRYRRDALEDELARLGQELREAAKLAEAVLWASTDLRLFDEDADPDLTDWINIAEVAYADPSSGIEGREDGDGSQKGSWQWALRRVPLSVAGVLSDVWKRSHSTVLTSATLRSGDSFDYLIRRLGIGAARTDVLDSPFENLPKQHLLLLTDYLPAPRGRLMDRFTEIEAREIPRLCVASEGGALALMTARARLEYVRDHARPHLAPLGLELLAQGDGSSPALVEQMRSDRSTSLLGLRSFWEGVDIPGEALRLLIIEKIPFDSIGDPVVAARTDLIERQNLDPFAEYIVPRAAIAFAQGVGRLIRTADDTGVTVVLDNRIRRPIGYRDVLLRSLSGPPASRNIDTPEQAYRAITDHLRIVLDEERWERIEHIPGIPTLSQGALEITGEAALDHQTVGDRLEAARQWLGFEAWRPGQQEIMTMFIEGEDTVAVLPTGSGKSVTYQVPALVSPGVTLVISPLIALMRDQVDNLRAKGVTEAAAIYAGVGQAEQRDILRAAADGHIKLLYVSPERLWSPVFRSWLGKVDVRRIAIDEAHCISMWGHSFRPEYAVIPRAISDVTTTRLPVLAVTATATPQVLDDISDLLELREPSKLSGSANRPEIHYFVERCRNKRDRDLRVAKVVEAFRRQSAIVYVPTRKDTTRLSSLLRIFGHRVRPYSGAMEYTEREHTEDAFRHGEIDVVVATKAFGLGIDKPDIALIVHLEMPASIEEYVQETGRVARGARDGTGPETGTAVLMVTPRDCRIREYFIRSSVPEPDEVYEVFGRLRPGLNFLDPASLSNRPEGEDQEGDQTTALALHYLDRIGAVTRHQDFVLDGRVTLVDHTWELFDRYRSQRPQRADRAEAVLRHAEKVGGDYRWSSWRDRLGMTPTQTEAVLFDLQKEDICDFTGWKFGWVFELLDGAEPDRPRLREMLRIQREAVEQRAIKARELARGAPDCRRREMLRYLGENEPGFATCGGCDACTPGLPRRWAGIDVRHEQVREAVEETATLTILILVDSVSAGHWSRRNLVRTLRGDGGGPYPLDRRLALHSCFAQLAMLTTDQVEDRIDELIHEGILEATSPDGRDYETLRLTERGQEIVRGRYAR